MFAKNFYISIILTVLSLCYPGDCYSQNFQAAAVTKNITPDRSLLLINYGGRKSTGIHDRIYHRIVVLDDGESQFFLISSELCFISPSEYDRVANILKKRFNIARKNVWWSVTHTHSTPGVGPNGLVRTVKESNKKRYKVNSDTSYTKFAIRQLVEGIEEAKSQLQPAQLGVGWGYSQANINRRGRGIDGPAFLGMNPGGPVDRRIGILKITKRSDNSLLSLIANYPIHGTVLGGENTLISGDAPGIVSQYVEKELGAPMLFINGAAGNIAPIYSTYPSPQAGHLTQFKAMLGDKIIKAGEKITSDIEDVSLSFGNLTLRTPKKNGVEWPEKLTKYLSSDASGNDIIKLPIQFLKINEDIAIWNAPLELFCELSNEVRDQSPFPYTFYYGYTNGWLGYMPTKQAYEYGGYEPSVSPYIPSAGKELVKAVSAYLQGELMSK